jgi:hypothetical protein
LGLGVGLFDILNPEHQTHTLYEDGLALYARTRPDESGRERTRVDESGREWTRADESGREWTRMDESGREWTRMDESAREWTRMNESGREWTLVLYSVKCLIVIFLEFNRIMDLLKQYLL